MYSTVLKVAERAYTHVRVDPEADRAVRARGTGRPLCAGSSRSLRRSTARTKLTQIAVEDLGAANLTRGQSATLSSQRLVALCTQSFQYRGGLVMRFGMKFLQRREHFAHRRATALDH